jgi:hypothetical protein
MSRLFIRYKHYDILNYKYRDVDDCFSNSIEQFKSYLLKYPGLAGAVGYGKNFRTDLKAWIILEHNGRVYEFETAKQMFEFVRKDVELAKSLGV